MEDELNLVEVCCVFESVISRQDCTTKWRHVDCLDVELVEYRCSFWKLLLHKCSEQAVLKALVVGADFEILFEITNVLLRLSIADKQDTRVLKLFDALLWKSMGDQGCLDLWIFKLFDAFLWKSIGNQGFLDLWIFIHW
jgi:hypothetical protein